MATEVDLRYNCSLLPVESLDIGNLSHGPSMGTELSNLNMWYKKNNTIEIRIPWMALGFTDPSSKMAANYPSQGINFHPIYVLSFS
jgi:hypothetical protein